MFSLPAEGGQLRLSVREVSENFLYSLKNPVKSGSQANRVRRNIPTKTVDFFDEKLKSVRGATG